MPWKTAKLLVFTLPGSIVNSAQLSTPPGDRSRGRNERVVYFFFGSSTLMASALSNNNSAELPGATVPETVT